MKTNYLKLERIVKGFANHRRLQILDLLKKEPELTVDDISERLNINIDKIDTLESPRGHKDKDHTIFKAHKWTT